MSGALEVYVRRQFCPARDSSFLGVYTWHLFIGYLSQLVYNYQTILSQVSTSEWPVIPSSAFRCSICPYQFNI